LETPLGRRATVIVVPEVFAAVALTSPSSATTVVMKVDWA
jgi:hypothetical protein